MRVLLIEDNPGDARFVREILREASANFTVSIAERLAQGIEFLLSQEVDVVLLDLGLPDSRGLVTLTKLQTRFSHLPIVIMTGSGDESLGIQAVQLGAQDYLVKGQVNGELLKRALMYAAERKRTEEAVLHAKEEWELTFNSVPDLIAILDRQHRVIRVNKAMAARLGTTPDKCVGLRCYEAVHQLPHPPEFCPHTLTCQDCKEHVADIHEKCLGGDFLVSTTPMFDNEGLVTGSVHVARDITARKRAEKALKEREQFLERMAELNPAVISVIDLTDNQEVYSSKPVLGSLGYKGEEIKDSVGFLSSILYPGDFERLVAAAVELKEANDPRIRDIEVRARSADGKWRWLQILYVIFKRDINGAAQQVMSVARDVTEHKEIEEALRNRTAELETANKELEAFSYSVSHDLRAPLRSMDGFSKMLIEEYGEQLDDKGKGYLERIRTSGRLMAQLIDDLLRLSRVGRVEMKAEDVDLSELTRSIAEELRRTQPGRKCEFVVAERTSAIGDRTLLKILLQNLMENAWKYSGKVERGRIEFGALLRDGEKVYFVKDNGVGFDMKYAKKLFEPFERFHSSNDFTGTGIGLAIVQRIIDRHGSRVWAEGEIGKGAAFYFTLRSEDPEIRDVQRKERA